MNYWTTPIIFLTLLGAVSAYNLTVLHTNDVHAHYVEFNVNGGRCPPDYAKEGKCYGGFARQSTKVKEIRASHPNVLFLNGGDFFQGTVWYTLYKWKTVAEFVNKLTIDAMSLGNHEFDDGLKGLLPYLEEVQPKVTVCNIDSSQEPEFGKLVSTSVVLDVNGEKLGIIGYLTPETKYLSSVGKLEFSDEVECIQKEAKKLSAEGINKIFAVGHSGYEEDMKIARNVPEIDVVVGGHTNTFLYTGESPSVEVAQGPYPTVIERDDGSKALVVQNFAFGKYLGYLDVVFDNEGHVQSYGGNPILLDSNVEDDKEILELLEPYKEEVVRRGRQPVGRTNVLLEGNRLVCRMRECNLGNFLADAALDFFVNSPPNEEGWNNVAVSLWNSGGIRGSIDEKLNNGTIILEDILTIAPFGNTMDIVGLKGKHLKEVLETSVREYDTKAFDPPGSLLQVSGLRVVFNVSNPPGSRVLHVDVRCADCRIPEYHPMEEEKVYEVVLSTYLTKGGDGFDVIPQNAVSNRNTDELDVDIITQYMKKMDPATTGLENRFTVLSDEVQRSPLAGIPDLSKLGDLGGNLFTNMPDLSKIGDLGGKLFTGLPGLTLWQAQTTDSSTTSAEANDATVPESNHTEVDSSTEVSTEQVTTTAVTEEAKKDENILTKLKNVIPFPLGPTSRPNNKKDKNPAEKIIEKITNVFQI